MAEAEVIIKDSIHPSIYPHPLSPRSGRGGSRPSSLTQTTLSPAIFSSSFFLGVGVNIIIIIIIIIRWHQQRMKPWGETQLCCFRVQPWHTVESVNNVRLAWYVNLNHVIQETWTRDTTRGSVDFVVEHFVAFVKHYRGLVQKTDYIPHRDMYNLQDTGHLNSTQISSAFTSIMSYLISQLPPPLSLIFTLPTKGPKWPGKLARLMSHAEVSERLSVEITRAFVNNRTAYVLSFWNASWPQWSGYKGPPLLCHNEFSHLMKWEWTSYRDSFLSCRQTVTWV